MRSPQLAALLLAASPLIDAASCPFQARNQQRDVHTTLDTRADGTETSSFGVCPRKSNKAGGGSRSYQFWPCQLRLDVLRQNAVESDPFGGSFDYAAAFNSLDYDALKADILAAMTDSQEWWPADFGTYAGLFVRMAWHSAGTYRVFDGRGGSGMGQQRFDPLGSWPDNQSLDKARRLVWSVKQKYGRKISWADLIILFGNVALESTGFPILGYGGGRVDTWQADESIYWGSEQEFVPAGNTDRYNGSTDFYDRAAKLEIPLAATHMGLIYVNPQGPNGEPDPKASALDIRTTFLRMGMNDSETVSLIAGGHALGKCHGAASDSDYVGAAPAAADIEEQGLGWANSYQTGVGADAITSGLELVWTKTPTEWNNGYLASLWGNEWSVETGPGGAKQWIALNGSRDYPKAFDNTTFDLPKMLTSDIALREDAIYANISSGWKNDFDGLTYAFARSWFKLTHRDMGPISRYLGPEVPAERFIWQDPLPDSNGTALSDADVTSLKQQILDSGLSRAALVSTAWACASTYRHTDKRGGCNGAHLRLEPQASWAINTAAGTLISDTIASLEGIQASSGASIADLIVLGGSAAVEAAAHDAGFADVTVPFLPGRVDALQEDTDVESFGYLEPTVDGFRNYGVGNERATTEEFLVDRANLLSLTVPETTALVGGLRVLGANADGSANGVFTNQTGVLSTDFFVNLLDIQNVWAGVDGTEVFQGTDRATGDKTYTATRSDLIFGSQPELRAVAEVYGSADAGEQFVNDFIKAWNKVMNADRFDVAGYGTL